MKIVCYKDTILKAINSVVKAVAGKTTMPILEGILIQTNDNEIKLLPKRYSYEPYGIAFKKGDSTVKLKEILDFAIRDLQKQNYIYKLRQKWNVL